MPTIYIPKFDGVIPLSSGRLLPDGSGQLASNVNLVSGEIKPLRKPKFTALPTKPSPFASIYFARNDASTAWMTWVDDVDVVRAPLPADVESRYYWSGDGEPRYGTFTNITNGGANDYPKVYYSLGVPTPQIKPVVSVTGGVGSSTDRWYCYTYFSALGEESGPSPVSSVVNGKVDGTWTIAGMNEVPESSGSGTAAYTSVTTFTNKGANLTVSNATNATPIVVTTGTHSLADYDIVNISGVGGNTAANGTWQIRVLSGTTFSLYQIGTSTAVAGNGAYTTGGTANKYNRHWLRAGDDVVINSTTLTVASVPSAYTFTVAGDYSAYTTWARKAAWNTSSMKRRLYRTTGTLGTFELVSDDVSTSYTDTITDANILGDELISAGWEPPSPYMLGLSVHSSGSIVGFYDTRLCMSVPYQPHAWIEANQLGTDYDIVGIATSASDVMVATKGTPYVASGVEPESMTMQKISGLYPCLSKRSVCSVGDGAIYASKHGLMYIGQSGVSLFTKNLFTKDEWYEHSPENMTCEFAYGRVYVSTTGTNSLKYMMIFEGNSLTFADVTTHDLYTDAATGTLYIATETDIREWDAIDTAPLTMAWKSKMYVLPPPQNFGAAKIEFDNAIDEATRLAILAEISAAQATNSALITAGTVNGGFNSFAYNETAINGSDLVTVTDNPATNEVTFILYSKGEPVFSRVVSNEKAFRLPAGFKTDEIEVQVNSQCIVNAIRVATTMTALNQV